MSVSAANREMVVRKTILVACSPERAFDVFTREYARWWPFATHSVGELETETVTFEPGVDGRIYERTRAGAEHVWGSTPRAGRPFSGSFLPAHAAEDFSIPGPAIADNVGLAGCPGERGALQRTVARVQRVPRRSSG
jgi:hypothetical protein